MGPEGRRGNGQSLSSPSPSQPVVLPLVPAGLRGRQEAKKKPEERRGTEGKEQGQGTGEKESQGTGEAKTEAVPEGMKFASSTEPYGSAATWSVRARGLRYQRSAILAIV